MKLHAFFFLRMVGATALLLPLHSPAQQAPAHPSQAASQPGTYWSDQKILDTVNAVRHFNHLARDLVGPSVRSPLRKFSTGEKIELVLSWDESARHFVEQQCSRGQLECINAEYDATMTERALHGAVIALRATVKEAVERMEQPPKETFDPARQHIFRRIASPE